MPKVGLVVPILKNHFGFSELMASVRQEVYPIIIDNWVHKSRCVAASWNQGIDTAISADCTHALVSNDDVLLGSRLIPELINALDTLPDCIMATARNCRGTVTTINTTQADIDACAVEGYGESPDYACFMVRADFFSQHGRFDENVKPAYFEDNLSHRVIKLIGKHAYSIGKAPMLHRGSQTQNFPGSPPAVTGSDFDRNRAYYQRRWGGNPGEEKFDHPFNNPAIKVTEWILGT